MKWFKKRYIDSQGRWFAWYPVFLKDQKCWAWLEVVYKHTHYIDYLKFNNYYK